MLSVAPAVLAALPLAGRVVTGAAREAQRAVCQPVFAAGGVYRCSGNRTQLPRNGDIARRGAALLSGEWCRYATQRGRHGDRQAGRRQWASSARARYRDWGQPAAAVGSQWAVAHRLQGVRDVTLGEDGC